MYLHVYFTLHLLLDRYRLFRADKTSLCKHKYQVLISWIPMKATNMRSRRCCKLSMVMLVPTCIHVRFPATAFLKYLRLPLLWEKSFLLQDHSTILYILWKFLPYLSGVLMQMPLFKRRPELYLINTQQSSRTIPCGKLHHSLHSYLLITW